MGKKPTIRDVAKLAGVSPSTVSRVRNKNAKISQKTKKLVWKAMEELDYAPNFSAQSLAGRGTKTLAVLVHVGPYESFDNDFFVEILQSICTKAEEALYHVLLVFAQNEEEEYQKTKDLVNSNRVDGFILLTIRELDRTAYFLKKKEIPFVVVGEPKEAINMLWVDNDNGQAMKNLVETLIQDGFRKFGLITGPTDLLVTKRRKKAFEENLAKCGYPSPDQWIYSGKFSIETGYEGGKKLLEEGVEVIVSTDDVLAYGAWKAVQEAKKEIVVTGFNNSKLSKLILPPISSVDIQIKDLGRLAIEKLIFCLEGKKVENRSYVQTKFIKRYEGEKTWTKNII